LRGDKEAQLALKRKEDEKMRKQALKLQK